MEFDWINFAGALIVILMLIPNIIYAIRNKEETNRCTNQWMNRMEQTGRYACIVLMCMPLLVWKFSFRSNLEMVLYLVGNGILLGTYLFVFSRYLKEKNAGRALILAILPACIFFWSGLMLRHWLLVFAAVLFSIGHIYVTKKNNE